jgi:hypothetical protein
MLAGAVTATPPSHTFSSDTLPAAKLRPELETLWEGDAYPAEAKARERGSHH